MIIDARIRAPFGAEGELLRNNKNLGKAKTFGLGCAPSALHVLPEELVREMDEAGIDIAMVTGRGRFADRNGELLDFARMYPGRFGVLPYLDPTREKLAEEVHSQAEEPEVKGFSIQYFSDNAACYDALDPAAMAMYAIVAETGKPLMITLSGHTVASLDSRIITQIDYIATSFPQMPILITHGGWPWVLDAIGLAFRRKNVYLIPDCYCTNGAGAQEYVRAANYMIPDKLLFASSYPLISQKEMVDHYINAAGFYPDVLPKVMGENAKRVFGL